MKILRLFSALFIISAISFLSCTNSESVEKSTESTTLEPIDTMHSTSEDLEIKVEEKSNDNPADQPLVNQKQTKNKTTQETVNESSEEHEKVKKVTIEKSESINVENYDFINSFLGEKIADDFKGDLMTIAAGEVYIERKGKCGNEDCGKKIILVNANPVKSIDISVEIVWKKNNKKTSEKRNYKIKKSQKLAVGCSSMCDLDNTKIKWNIIGAVYAE